MKLGKLEIVKVREVWPNEAHHFTPWMLENIEHLSEVLGMDINLSHKEEGVGDFWLDLIGTEENSGDIVIIENQLERSDHSHLGQLLTYAAGTDATNIVWVAPEFREEHRAAVDWLNSRTNDKTRFFAVEIKVVKIGDSDFAPLFQVVAKPNGWQKAAKASASSDEADSPKSAKYFEFWERYLSEVKAKYPGWTNSNNPPKTNWISLKSGISAITFGVNFGSGGLKSELYFGDADPEVNKARYELLDQDRLAIEQEFGRSLIWQPLEGKKACRISEVYPEGDVFNDDDWDKYFEWVFDSQARMRKVFGPRLEAFKGGKLS